jgi:hypothetical protein
MAQLSEKDWKNIIDDIRDQKAVLLIGPELIQLEGKSLNQLLREYLHEECPDDILYYYERDGLYLFKSPVSKVSAIQELNRFYKDVKPDSDFLQRLVQIPFHLVVSLNPDTFLSEAFYRHQVKHRFHYFHHKPQDNQNTEIEKPTSAMPLIYNLFGTKDKDESLVLDHDDVYSILHSAFSAPGLPNKFLVSFREARTYIFLGFHFDKWYSQLLLKFLNGKDGRGKLLSIHHPRIEADTYQFMISEFKIKFIGSEHDFFEQLYKRCDLQKDAQKKKMLRSIAETALSPEAIEILKRVAIGEVDNALDLLLEAADGLDWERDIVLLKGRFTRLEEDKEKTDSRDYRVELAKILDAIIEYTKQIGDDE